MGARGGGRRRRGGGGERRTDASCSHPRTGRSAQLLLFPFQSLDLAGERQRESANAAAGSIFGSCCAYYPLVCVLVWLPPTSACMHVSARVCIACVYVCGGGGGCAQTICLQTSLQAPREGGVAMGRRASLVRCGRVHLAAVHSLRSIGTHSRLRQASPAGGRCVHPKWVHMCRPDLGAAPSPFPLKAGEHNPSPHPGGREL